MNIFAVTWIDDECMNTRLYTKREDVEKLTDWCKEKKLDYLFVEETVDREIINKQIKSKCKDCFKKTI